MKLSVEEAGKLFAKALWDEAKPTVARKFAKPLRNGRKTFEVISVVRDTCNGVDTVLAHAQALFVEAFMPEKKP